MNEQSPSLDVQFQAEGNTFSIQSANGGLVLREARLELNGRKDFQWDLSALYGQGLLETPLGTHPGWEIATLPADGVKLVLQIAGGGGDNAALLRLKILNTGENPLRIKRFSVICNGIIDTGLIKEENSRTLDGLSGAGDTRVLEGLERSSPNNLLAVWKSCGRAWDRSVVAGGLTYTDFAKYFSAKYCDGSVSLDLYAEDPVGRLLDPGEEWSASDWFYLDLWTEDPFLALENYARTVASANKVALNRYDFPTICAWYASTPMYGGGEFINDTPGTVKAIEAAKEAGFLEYSPVAVRLVPDTYDGTSSKHEDPSEAGLMTGNMQWSKDRNTEQGWWDDEHWYRFGHYARPYETSAKWAKAILDRGCIPLTYVQAGHVSHDYANAYPGHMLGNDISELDRIFKGHNPYVTYDYTDPGFIEHLRGVWRNLRDAGVAGLMFDYPNQAWIEDGGFEDPKATTTSAYRTVYKLAKEGLGPRSWIHERNIARKVPYLDVTVGLVDSQRVWADTDAIDPFMYRMCGLRWYKTRTLFTYDTDAKNLNRIAAASRDRLRQALTLLYLLTGRLLLSNPFSGMSREVIHDLSRIYPEHPEPISPRPVDLFDSLDNPRTYVLSFSPFETHLILVNPDSENCMEISPKLFDSQLLGGVGLDPKWSYHAYDFWNDAYLGLIGNESDFKQALRPSEARAIVFRQVMDHPQILSSNRHVLQGHVELRNLHWSESDSSLKGSILLPTRDPIALVVARNQWTGQPDLVLPETVSGQLDPPSQPSLIRCILTSPKTGWVDFCLVFPA